MAYFQDVVNEYLQQPGVAMFIRTECPIQLDPGRIPARGTLWYCDAVAVSFKEKKVYLCEVTYSKTLYALLKKLEAWSKEWPRLREAIIRDSSIPIEWEVQPWVFIPEKLRKRLDERLSALANASSNAGTVPMPTPRVRHLELVLPWNPEEQKGTACETEADA